MLDLGEKYSIDISENWFLEYGVSLLDTLLFDRTTRRNIIWGTTDYEYLGDDYKAQFPITRNLITGNNNNVIQPRILKEKANQTRRTKNKAEVFTPAWACNNQNNLIDVAWFGRNPVFNVACDGNWTTIQTPILFDDKPHRRWTDYVDEKRLEIACGEAPYLVSRYDSVSGEYIGVNDRIGLLDRKLRVVNENTANEEEWMNWTIRAFQSIYGFEFQGDSLLLARENLLCTFIDYYNNRFNRSPTMKKMETIANIISWNIWQMDGINYTVPFGSISEQYQQLSLEKAVEEKQHKQCYCKIRDWRSKETVTFVSLVHSSKGDLK